MSDRKSPSGPVASIKGTIAIAATPVGTTAAATATGSFTPSSGPNVKVGDVLSLSPQANLTASIGVAFARVIAAGTVVIGFTNVGASTSQAAVTFDADAQTR
jgi:hypothetical protein